MPDQWKLARVTPIPKIYPPVNVEKHLRPIAVTNSLAKVAEKFVSRHFNEYYDELTDANQFGCVRNRSTHVTPKGQGRDPHILKPNISKTLGDRGSVPIKDQ